jgi:hypothetical protein
MVSLKPVGAGVEIAAWSLTGDRVGELRPSPTDAIVTLDPLTRSQERRIRHGLHRTGVDSEGDLRHGWSIALEHLVPAARSVDQYWAGGISQLRLPGFKK